MMDILYKEYKNHKAQINRIAGILFLLSLGALYLGFRDYLFFHNAVELFSVIIAINVTIIAVNTYDISENGFFIFLGIAFGFISSFYLLHVFESHKNSLGIDQIDRATQLSIAAKYLESLTFLVICLLRKKLTDRMIHPRVIFVGYFFVCAAVVLSIYNWGIFPRCIVPEGPTWFKVMSEYIIIGIYLVVIATLLNKRRKFASDFGIFLIVSMFLKIASQVFFSLYYDVYDIFSIMGHLLRVVSFYFIYKALIETSLKKPFHLLFNRLKISNHELQWKAQELLEANRRLTKENSERKLAEEALRESKEGYQRLVHLMPVSIFLQEDYQFLFVNQEGARFLGVEKPDQLVGRSVIECIHPDFQQDALDRLEALYNGTEDVPMVERKFIRVDGTGVFGEVASIRLTYKKKELVLSVVRDITERKRSEQLEKNIKRNEDLLREVVELDKIKTEFFSNISHELRTPLNLILCTLQMFDLYAKNNVIQDPENKFNRNVSIMKQNCYRLTRLVNNLIDTTKFSSGYYEIRLQNYNIVSIIEETTLSVSQYVENKGIVLEFDTEVEELVISCDAEKIERIVLNLLSNATKFTPAGGRISVNVYKKEDKVVVFVKDTGIGIPEDKLEAIFQRFIQVDKSLTRAHEGSGIGLSLVKSMVEMHEGKVYAKSILGEGSEFIIELPIRTLPIKNQDQKGLEAGVSKDVLELIHIEFSDVFFKRDEEAG